MKLKNYLNKKLLLPNYLDYYNISYQYLNTVLNRLEGRFSQEELEVVKRVLKVMDEELMPEIPI